MTLIWSLLGSISCLKVCARLMLFSQCFLILNGHLSRFNITSETCAFPAITRHVPHLSACLLWWWFWRCVWTLALESLWSLRMRDIWTEPLWGWKANSHVVQVLGRGSAPDTFLSLFVRSEQTRNLPVMMAPWKSAFRSFCCTSCGLL